MESKLGMKTNSDSLIDTTAAIKALVHDVRSPLLSMKIRVLFSTNINSLDKNILEKEISKISEVLNYASKKYVEHNKNVLEAIQQLADDLNVHLGLIQSYLQSLKELAQNEKEFFLQQLKRIDGVLISLIQKYSNDAISENQWVLASQVIKGIITEKKSEYQGQQIQFKYDVSENSEFALIKTNQSDLQRMLSNIINNSVEALSGKDGFVNINLTKSEHGIKIIISDNGSGIPAEVIEKIMSNEIVTHGKAHGQGIGYQQIRETLAKNGAKLYIESNQELRNTKVTLTFPNLKNSEGI